MFGYIGKYTYLCTAFKEMHYRFFGSLGEWLKPAVC